MYLLARANWLLKEDENRREGSEPSCRYTCHACQGLRNPEFADPRNQPLLLAHCVAVASQRQCLLRLMRGTGCQEQPHKYLRFSGSSSLCFSIDREGVGEKERDFAFWEETVEVEKQGLEVGFHLCRTIKRCSPTGMVRPIPSLICSLTYVFHSTHFSRAPPTVRSAAFSGHLGSRGHTLRCPHKVGLSPRLTPLCASSGLYLFNTLRSYKDEPVTVLTKGRRQGGFIPIIASPEILSSVQSPIRPLAPCRNLSGPDPPVPMSAPAFWPRPALGVQGCPSACRQR